MHRIRGLRFDIIFTSSLPPFPDAFTANAPNHLELGGREGNGLSFDVRESVTPTAPDRRHSSLWSLLIDRQNYCDNLRTAKLTSLKVLAIADYTPFLGELFMSSDFLLPITTLGGLDVLRIDNIALVSAPHDVREPPPNVCPKDGDVDVAFRKRRRGLGGAKSLQASRSKFGVRVFST
jgi:hypothetical protein